ncbi:MAG: hypothetical protein AAGK78_17780 [Planctomycetota bacterium]
MNSDSSASRASSHQPSGPAGVPLEYDYGVAATVGWSPEVTTVFTMRMTAFFVAAYGLYQLVTGVAGVIALQLAFRAFGGGQRSFTAVIFVALSIILVGVALWFVAPWLGRLMFRELRSPR